MDWKEQVKKLFSLKLKFAATSSIATAVDYFLYLILVYTVLTPVYSNIISGVIGIGVNFYLQKRFVFDMRRKLSTTFLIAMCVSAGWLGLMTLIVHYLSQIPFFNVHQYLTKLIATGVGFFYNFYFKRFAFEKRFFSVD